MHAMTRNVPPHTPRYSMSMWNTLLSHRNVYLFEFKVVEMAPEGAAMGQLKDRRYADRYRGRGEPIYLIGVEFSKDTRNVVAFEVERA